eukprot:scaffold11598_cov22-Tisochrysis_lutea.AAC.4
MFPGGHQATPAPSPLLSLTCRENFLAAEADRALAEMCRRVSEHRAMAALCACANHKSMHVRAKVGCLRKAICTVRVWSKEGPCDQHSNLGVMKQRWWAV